MKFKKLLNKEKKMSINLLKNHVQKKILSKQFNMNMN